MFTVVRKHMKYLFKIYSLKSKILVNLILFTVVPFLVIAAVIYSFMCDNIMKEHEKKNIQLLDSCAGLINSEINLYINRSKNIATNKAIAAGLEAYLEWDAEKAVDFQNRMTAIVGDLEHSFNRNNYNTFMFYLSDYNGPQGSYVARMNSVGKNDILHDVLNATSNQVIWSPQVKIDIYNRKYMIFYRNITNIIGHKSVFEINIPYENIKRYLDGVNISEDCIIMHTNSYGEILYIKGAPEGIGNTGNIDTNSYFLMSKELAYESGVVTVAMPRKLIASEYRKVLIYMFLVLIAITVFTITASIATTSRITMSLNCFINDIKNNEDIFLGNEQIEVDGEDEVSVIKSRFIRLIRKMNETYRDLMDMKHQNSMLEVELLQSRINPHLLYNSLSVIKWNALRQRDTRTVQLIDAMTSYYRVALSKGNNVIDVGSELNMIREYMRIVNFTHSFQYRLIENVDSNMLNLPILKHLLQPIIENSVLHGLNGKGEDGTVIINGYMEGDDIIFKIIDNGYGMDQDRIDSLLSLNYSSSYGGYGIKNIIKRIRYCYGENYGLSIESEQGVGTTVTVRVKALDKQVIEAIMKR